MALKHAYKLKVSIERTNLHLTFMSFIGRFTEIGLFNVCILKKKSGIRESDKKQFWRRDFREKGKDSRRNHLYWSKTTKYQTLAIYCHVMHPHFRFELFFTT